MPPFITPTVTPMQQAQRLAQRETSFLLTKLTLTQVAICDRKARRGTPKWRETARSFMPRTPKATRRPTTPPTPRKRFIVRRFEYSAGPFDMQILADVDLSFSEEDGYDAPVERLTIDDQPDIDEGAWGTEVKLPQRGFHFVTP